MVRRRLFTRGAGATPGHSLQIPAAGDLPCPAGVWRWGCSRAQTPADLQGTEVFCAGVLSLGPPRDRPGGLPASGWGMGAGTRSVPRPWRFRVPTWGVGAGRVGSSASTLAVSAAIAGATQ